MFVVELAKRLTTAVRVGWEYNGPTRPVVVLKYVCFRTTRPLARSPTTGNCSQLPVMKNYTVHNVLICTA